jgi:pyruvate dehydrogenase E2 component (dihydrolipoamide acetyltransferase)
MAEIIKMPRLSDTMEEGNIVAWLKKVGDSVKAGDILAEVETDKATMELESFFDGTLLYIGVDSGNVPVDGIIAIIGNTNEDWKALLTGQTASAPAPAAIEVTTQEAPKEIKPTEPTVAPVTAAVISEIDSRVKASPLAKSLASQSGISLSDIAPSTEHGRIIKKDIENYIANPKAQPVASTTSNNVVASAPITIKSDVAYGDLPVTQMRKVIAKRLSESLFTAPHFYLTLEINMDNAIAARTAINADGDAKISYNDFVVKACASSLRKHPMINSSWLGDKITIHEDIHIGVAVAVPDGLLVPVIQHADRKSLSFINKEVKTLAGKAKEKKLQPNEMSGNTFTISNLGMFDIEVFTAIINSPDACILAVGSIVQKPIVKNGEIVVGNTMKVTLSCDHRVVDGATAAQFLQTLKGILENPVKMLV